jgi:ribosomal-protein-alanine N-acetyltransferase
MKISNYHPNHRETCIDIFTSNTPAYFGVDELQGLELWLNGQDAERLAYKNTEVEHFYVLEDKHNVLACGGFYIVRDSPIANMTWGMVHNNYHKQGFGKALFEYRIEQIKTKYPQHNIVLDTTQHTYAFFEKLGFHVTEIRKDFYAPGLNRYDMALSTA